MIENLIFICKVVFLVIFFKIDIVELIYLSDSIIELDNHRIHILFTNR